METPSYQYQPLQHSDSVRMLVLHPSQNEADPIECTICHENLSDGSLYYEAVSYTWGNSGRTHVIQCNDAKQSLSVGRNCHAALRRLRLPWKRRKLWIDAVCINQEDPLERGHQVRMMKDVYDFAWGVMVMLNDQVPDCRLLLDQLSSMPQGSDAVSIDRLGATMRQVEALYEDPWFQRTWVLQEIYNKSHITIVYGSATIPFEALIRLGLGSSPAENNWPVHVIILIAPLQEFSTSQFTLWNWLYETRQCLATNPRDNVFALKSLLGRKQLEMDYLVDYTQSVEDCFTNVAGFLLPVLGPRILAATRHPHDSNMASWIPDWSQNLPLDFSSFSRESDDPSFIEAGSLLAPTTGDHDRTLQSYSNGELRNNATIHIRGCQIARILECSKGFRFVNLDDAAKQMRNVYNEFDDLRQYLHEEDKSNTATVSGHFTPEILKRMSNLHGIDLRDGLMRGTGLADLPYTIPKDVTRLYDALQHCCISLTNDDELVIVPEAAQPGDIVCIISGTRRPCLLREDQDRYWTLISGDCHIFGYDPDTMREVDVCIEQVGGVEDFTLR